MSAGSCGLLSLPDELVLDIALHCDVQDIAHLSMVCKHLQSVCDDRATWISSLKNLDVNRAPDINLYTSLTSLSAAEAKEKLARAFRLEYGWRTKGTLTTTRRVTANVSPRERPGDVLEPANGRMEPLIIPGGEHVLLGNRGQLELWSVNSPACLWVAPSPSPDFLDCMAFDYDLQQDGAMLVISAAYIDIVRSRSYIIVHRLSMTTFHSDTVLRREMPMMSMFRLMVRGNIVMVHLPIEYRIYLFNLVDSSAVSLRFNMAVRGGTNFRSALIAEQCLFVVLNLGSFSLVSIPLAFLTRDWTVTENISQLRPIDLDLPRSSPLNLNPVGENTLPGLLRLSLEKPRLPSDGPWVLALHAFTPQWKDPSEKAVTEVYVVAYEKGSNMKANYLLSYRLQLAQTADTNSSKAEDMQNISDEGLRQQATAGGWRLRLVSRNRAYAKTLPWNAQSISNAGRMFFLHDMFHCFTLFTDEPQPSNQLPISSIVKPRDDSDVEGPDPLVMTVEPTSGDVVVGIPGMFQILSFDIKERGGQEVVA